MKVYCINKSGESLRPNEYKSLEKDMLGRFGATGYSQYGEIGIEREYIVMGLIIFETFQA